MSSGVLSALNHEKVLRRGFAIVINKNSKLVRTSKGLKNKENLKIKLSNNDILKVKTNLKE